MLSYNVEFGLDVIWKSRVGWKFDIIEILNICNLILCLVVSKFNVLPVVGPPVRTEVNAYLAGFVCSTEEIKIIPLEKGKFAARFSNCTELGSVSEQLFSSQRTYCAIFLDPVTFGKFRIK